VQPPWVHPCLTAEIISKEALCQYENITSRKRARCHVIKENKTKH
jgi:hypothetical protein